MTDPIVVLARFLGDQLEWMRHRAEADEFLADVERCARVVRSIARGPAEQKYLGPCGAMVGAEAGVNPDGEVFWVERSCDGDVYGPRDGKTGRCKACGATVETKDREAWLDGEVRSWAFSARDIADAHRINVKTIRTWAARGQLKTYWRTEAGIVADWTEPGEGGERERLHYVGDVLDLAAADAARRETNRAKRERRLTLAGTEEDAA